MMGDNRDNSTDSRFLGQVGYVPYENLVGRATIIFFSHRPDTILLRSVEVARRHPLEPAVPRSGLVARRSPAALAELYERIGYKVRTSSCSTGPSPTQATALRPHQGLRAPRVPRRQGSGAGGGRRALPPLSRYRRRRPVAAPEPAGAPGELHRSGAGLGLGEYIRWGTRTNDIASNPRVLADACEALIAAIYLDGGLEPARQFILRHWHDLFERAAAVGKDAKTALQEWALARALPVPVYYEETRSGPDHLPVFVMMVEVDGYEPSSGEGPSKRAAEQAAAQSFLQREGVWP
jgi:hypothetical protein